MHKQRLYDKKERINIIGKKLKKIDLIFAIDISWSTKNFRWKDGMLNIIPTILFIVMKHIEQYISNLIDEPNYSIPVNYILYWDGNPFSSFTSAHKNDPEQVKMSELNQEIVQLDGWTNDPTAWKKITYHLNDFMKNNPKYVEEVKTKQRKPMILQISDSDVSENWVNVLKTLLQEYFLDQQIVDSIPKRIVLWNIEWIHNISESEYQQKKADGELWNWEPVYENGKLKLRQIWVKQKKEITESIKALYSGFFSDLNF